MSGRYETEMQIDSLMKSKLDDMPEIVTDYYYHLIGSGKSYRTAQTYIDRLSRFINFSFGANCDIVATRL